MQKFKQHWVIILLTVVTLGAAFYWFEWRPKNIRTKCVEETRAHFTDAVKNSSGEKIDFYYKYCLLRSGLKN